jgi:hypothetical protein
MSLSGGTKLGTFEIVRLLGAGGMGEVYLAYDRQLNRDVAVKVVLPEFTRDPHRLARLAQEARAASALSHPNVCHIYHFDKTTNDQRYIAMEYVDGETLDERLNATRLPLREALDIAIQIAAALTAAHGAGIVHRDIKPANVKIRRDRLVKVLDFGLAKLPPSAMPHARRATTQTALATDPGTVVGTIDYMSPEQARGQEVDGRTDIWALGVVLYEMVAGRSPFCGTTRSDVLVAILDREPASLVGGTAPVPPELERIVSKALRKDPEQRYQVMKDLLLDLEALRGVIASPGWNRASDRPGRGRLFTSGRLVAAVATAALAVVGSWWITHRPAAGIHYTLDLMLEDLEVGGDMAPELSPDGQWLVYRAGGRLWRRGLNELTSRPLPDSTARFTHFGRPTADRSRSCATGSCGPCPSMPQMPRSSLMRLKAWQVPAPESGRPAVIWSLWAVTLSDCSRSPRRGGLRVRSCRSTRPRRSTSMTSPHCRTEADCSWPSTVPKGPTQLRHLRTADSGRCCNCPVKRSRTRCTHPRATCCLLVRRRALGSGQYGSPSIA